MGKKIYKEYILYKCNNCLRTFGNRKDNYETHINKKFPCKKVKNDIIVNETNLTNNPINENEEENLVLCVEINNTNGKNKVLNFSCEFCNGVFTKKYNLERHQKSRCKSKPLQNPDKPNDIKNKEDENKLNIILSELKELKEKNKNSEQKNLEKINKNINKLKTIIPSNSSQIINNQLIETIIKKEKKIDELDSMIKQPNSNKLIKSDDIIDNTDDINLDDNIDLKQNKPLDLIINNQIIQCRDSDGYVNATQLCKAGGKKFSHWIGLDGTKELISELETNAGIPALNLIDKNIGGNHLGTWIHPDLAIQLAQWICPKFAIQVSAWIRTLFSKGNVDINLKMLKEKENLIKDFQKRIKILENMTLKKHKRHDFPESTNVVYLITNEPNKKERTYVIGKAVDFKERLSTYNKSNEHEMIYYKPFLNPSMMKIAEDYVLEKLCKYRKQANRDQFILPAGEDIKLFTDVIDDAYSFFNK